MLNVSSFCNVGVYISCRKQLEDVCSFLYIHWNCIHHNFWHLLPDSTFSRLVRIPEIIETLQTPPERTDCTREVAARLKFLNGANK